MFAILCAAAILTDLSAARTALEDATEGKVTYRLTRHTVALSGDECRKLAELIRFEGGATDVPAGVVSTGHIFDIVLQVDGKEESVRLFGKREIRFGAKRQFLIDTRFHDELYHRFVPKEPEAERQARLVQTLERKVDIASAVTLDGGPLIVADAGRRSLHFIAYSPGGGRVRHFAEFKDERIAGHLALCAINMNVYLAGKSLLVLHHYGADIKLVQAVDHEELREPSAIALSPDGRHLIVACQASHRLLVYRIAKDGTLDHAQTVAHESLVHPTDLAIADSGRFVYVCNRGNNRQSALAVFERDVALGTLSFATAAIEQNYTVGRGIKHAMAMELDGERLLIATSGSLAFWQAVGDKLTFIHCWHGDPKEKGLHNVKDVEIDASGHLWVAGYDDDTLSWYERDQSEAGYKLGGSIEGLNEIQSLAVSADGMYVYAGGREKIWAIAGPDTPDPLKHLKAKP